MTDTAPRADPARTPWAVIVGLTVAVAGILRFIGLQSPLWYDEMVTLVTSARLPLRQIVSTFPDVNEHPLYSVLAHLSLVAFGDSAWSLRLPACVAGIATVLVVYRFGTTLVSRVEAWAAAAVLATSYQHIWFSQNARGYTLIGVLTLVSTDRLVRALNSGRAIDYTIYVLACVAGVYTHITMALVVAGQAVAVLVSLLTHWSDGPRGRLAPVLWAWTAAGTISLLAYAPIARSLLRNVGGGLHQGDASVATAGWAVTAALDSMVTSTGVLALLLGVVFAATGVVSLTKRRPFVCGLLLMPGLATALAIVALGWPVRPRLFFFLSGAGAIFVGRGMGALAAAIVAARPRMSPRWQSKTVVLAALVMVGASAPSLRRNYEIPKQDFDGAMALLDQAERQGVAIATASTACWPAENYYGRNGWPCIETDAAWREFAERPMPMWVMYSLPEYLEPALQARLRDDCPVVRRFPGTLGGGDVIVCDMRHESGQR